MLDVLTAGMSVAGGLAGLLQKQPTMTRREEPYNLEAAKGLRATQAQVSQINPAATAQAANQLVASGRDAAMGNALNMAAGQTATSGDFGGPMSAAIAGSQAASAATAPFTAQMSQNLQQADQTRLQQTSQLNNLANSIASLSNNVSYERTEQPNPILNALKGVTAGGNAGSNLFALLNNKRYKNKADNTTGAVGQ
jgi:hypothetical protein